MQDVELASENHEVEKNVALMKTNSINVDYTLSVRMGGVPERALESL